MGLFIRIPFLLALLLSSTALGGATNSTGARANIDLSPTIRVEIFNLLPHGKSFVVHCKSKEDDLGPHVIGPGKSYWFKFKNNVWITTLFFCGVTWEGGRAMFDIYKARRDQPRCARFCSWQAREAFIFGFQEGSQVADIVIPWAEGH